MERTIIYFDHPGPDNTQATLAAGRARAEELGLTHAVVSSLRGDTALAAAEVFQGLDIALIAVTERRGGRLSEDMRARLATAGVQVLSSIHAFHSAESAVHDVYGGAAREKVIADVLRWFGQGMKVAVECALMAVDAGLVPPGTEVVSFGGTHRGTDTAVILRATGLWEMFSRDPAERLAIREILAMPRYTEQEARRG